MLLEAEHLIISIHPFAPAKMLLCTLVGLRYGVNCYCRHKDHLEIGHNSGAEEYKATGLEQELDFYTRHASALSLPSLCCDLRRSVI